jgi:hypothetical protein
MPNTFVNIDINLPGATHSGMLRQLAQTQRQTYELAKRILEIMGNNSAPPDDFADLEKLFGLQAGEGNVVFDYVNGLVGALEGTFQNDNGKNIGVLIG